MEMNLVFDSWFFWCIRLQQAREAVNANTDSVNHIVYVRAVRIALRRCVQFERVLTGKRGEK